LASTFPPLQGISSRLLRKLLCISQVMSQVPRDVPYLNLTVRPRFAQCSRELSPECTPELWLRGANLPPERRLLWGNGSAKRAVSYMSILTSLENAVVAMLKSCTARITCKNDHPDRDMQAILVSQIYDCRTPRSTSLMTCCIFPSIDRSGKLSRRFQQYPRAWRARGNILDPGTETTKAGRHILSKDAAKASAHSKAFTRNLPLRTCQYKQ
jgi:hypothetical protein